MYSSWRNKKNIKWIAIYSSAAAILLSVFIIRSPFFKKDKVNINKFYYSDNKGKVTDSNAEQNSKETKENQPQSIVKRTKRHDFRNRISGKYDKMPSRNNRRAITIDRAEKIIEEREDEMQHLLSIEKTMEKEASDNFAAAESSLINNRAINNYAQIISIAKKYNEEMERTIEFSQINMNNGNINTKKQ